MQLIDRRTEDGSRHFASLPKTCTWHALHDHIFLLPGAQITNFVVERVEEPWIDFIFQGHRFSVNHRRGDYCFCVADPQCPDLSLYQVGSHCEKLLGSG